MVLLGALYRRIVAFVWRGRLERDLDDEVNFHLTMLETEQSQVDQGGAGAHATARRRF